jgi:hypothetical protein
MATNELAVAYQLDGCCQPPCQHDRADGQRNAC